MMIRRAVEILIVFGIGLVIGPFLPMSLDAPQSTTSLDRENLAIATSFYAAANTFLEMGDDAPLIETLDTSFVDHSAFGGEPTVVGLVRYLASLRLTYPDLRVDPEIIVTQKDIVTISLATTPAMTAIADGPVPHWDPSVPGVEQLRIRDGKVAERWASGVLPPQYEEVARVDLLQPAGWFIKLEIERLELESGASMTRRDAAPSLLIVSAGTLSIEAARDGETDLRVVMERGTMVNSALPRGAAIELGSESLVAIPKVVAYRLGNDRAETLIAIRVEFAYRAPTTTFVDGDINLVESTQGVVVYTQSGMLPPDVKDDRPFQLRLIRVNAAPKEQLPIHSVRDMEQVLVTGGVVEAAVYDGSVTALDQDGVGSEPLEGTRELFAGDFLTALPDALVSYQVTGTDPATAWFVSTVPAPGLA